MKNKPKQFVTLEEFNKLKAEYVPLEEFNKLKAELDAIKKFLKSVVPVREIINKHSKHDSTRYAMTDKKDIDYYLNKKWKVGKTIGYVFPKDIKEKL